MLVEIHMIQNHAPSNLNRDDTGSPKDCLFGGVRRSRISSQCLKRSIRKSNIFEEEMQNTKLGLRTRKLPELVKERLLKVGISEDLADIAAGKASGFGTKGGKKQSSLETRQIMFFSEEDIDAVVEVLKEEIEKRKTPEKLEKVKSKDLEAELANKGKRLITPDIALFGRMITSDAFQNVEASMQVAHAISTNKMEHEFDYFTAVDDLSSGTEELTEQGAGMIGDIEFNSACYYKYFTFDTNGFVENLNNFNTKADDVDVKQLLKDTLRAFVKGAVYTTPTGKQNTFAAHQLPDAILIEIRTKNIPVSYANAFVKPARPYGNKDLVDDSLEKFTTHVNLMTDKFGLEAKQRLWFTTRESVEIDGVKTCQKIDELLDELVGKV